MVCGYMDSKFDLPMLNDTNYGHFAYMKELYEFPYRELGGEKLAFVLNSYYQHTKRDNLEVFLYGADAIEPADFKLENYHTEVGTYGHTILRGPENRYLLLKHDSYGGEHDHYDRLGISYMAYGDPIARDLGTTGYGARMHYDYYKNTASHNTLAIGEENQSPVNGKLIRYEEKDGAVYAEAEADWTAPYEMPDSFTIVQWSEKNYKTVKMRRKIIWTDQYWIDVFLADGVQKELYSDWIFHIAGEKMEEKTNRDETEEEGLPQDYFTKKPLKYLHDGKMRKIQPGSVYKNVYQTENCRTSIYGMGNGQTVITAKGPDNPSVQELNYLIERRTEDSVLAVHVVESWKEEEVIKDVSFQMDKGRLAIVIQEKTGKKEFSVRICQ